MNNILLAFVVLEKNKKKLRRVELENKLFPKKLLSESELKVDYSTPEYDVIAHSTG